MSLLDPPTMDEPPESYEQGPAALAGKGDLPDRLNSWLRSGAAATFFVVAVCTIFTFVQLQPGELFKNTTPTGGDMGAHVWLPWYLEHNLLPHLRLTGWTMDNFSGFPALSYYFPLPMVMIVALNVILPYNIAFKLVSVLGLLTLPTAAWAFGRLSGARSPVPAILSLGTLPYLFCQQYTIYGGNIASTMAGEFSFSISLSLNLVFLGLVVRGLRTGRGRVIAPVVLACGAMSHIEPTMWGLVGALAFWIIGWARGDRDRWRFMLPTLVVGGALTGIWSFAFEFRLPYATNMGYENLTTYLGTLFPAKFMWLFILAAIGAVLSLANGRRNGTWLILMTVFEGFLFRFAPQSRLWNARVLPFWYLTLYLLAALAFYEVGVLLIRSFQRHERTWALWLNAVLAVTTVVTLIWVSYPLRTILPGGHTVASGANAGQYDWLGIKSPQSSKSFVPDWATWNYSGYQNADKTRETEYFQLVNAMGQVGKQYGCGRAMYEYQPSQNDFGTPDALMLLPYWTKSCIGSMEGLYYESSGTTPYHFINASELSAVASNPVVPLFKDCPTYDPQGMLETRDCYSGGANVFEGVKHLQMMGTRYYMAITPTTQQEANLDPDLQLVKRIGPYWVDDTQQGSQCSAPSSAQQPTGAYTSGCSQNYWNIYMIKNSNPVTPLANQPVVMRGTAPGAEAWLDPSVRWYTDSSRWNVYETAGGPKSWARVGAYDRHPPTKPLPKVSVSNVKMSESSISFDVDRPGVPVLVNTSYFPNWHASGASGPYRATPNMMVVVPTSKHISLHYGYTPLDDTGFTFTLLGLLALTVLWRAGPLRYPSRRRPRVVPAATQYAWQPGDDTPPQGWVTSAVYQPPPNQVGLPPDPPSVAKVATMADLDAASLDKIFKAYDIRGTVPQQIDESLAYQVGLAFAHFARTDRIIVARDMRPSGVGLVDAFTKGVTEQGVNVVDIGLCSTDEMYYASGSLDAPGAMWTASHNPAAYNGIKLCLAGAKPVGEESGLSDIKASILAGVPRSGKAAGKVTKADVLEDYAQKVRSFVNADSLRPLKVVADTANGMGGLVVPAVFDKLPFDLTVLFKELDGNFPNHPADPIQPENLRDLRAKILETKADVGLAFDGDADRCFLVDDKGEPVSGSTTTAIVAHSLLAKHPGATILHNLICSKAVPEIVTEDGGVPVRTRVGHSFIKAKMAECNAVFGGEHSGHYYFRDNYRADSGAIAALVVLELLSKADKPLSELRKPFERYAASGEINTKVPDPHAAIKDVADTVTKKYPKAKLDRLDGLTVDLGDWWFNLRPSNTEPLLRLNLEAPNAEACRAHTEEVTKLLKELA